jgi:hypothetical protein
MVEFREVYRRFVFCVRAGQGQGAQAGQPVLLAGATQRRQQRQAHQQTGQARMVSETLYYITLHYITLHYITLHYITLHFISLHYITSHHITLNKITGSAQTRNVNLIQEPTRAA